MKKIISFCLYGDNKKYIIGALENANTYKHFYPDWEMHLYVDNNCFFNNQEIMYKILKNNVVLHLIDTTTDKQMGVNWRFYALEESDVFISRDCDSRFSEREQKAVEEWLQSDKQYHIMRDHPLHGDRMLAGMWGYKGDGLRNIKQLLNEYCAGKNYWTLDQAFLAAIIYPKTINNAIVHDEYFKYEPYRKSFPVAKINNHFVGQVFTEDNKQCF